MLFGKVWNKKTHQIGLGTGFDVEIVHHHLQFVLEIGFGVEIGLHVLQFVLVIGSGVGIGLRVLRIVLGTVTDFETDLLSYLNV